MFKFFSDLKIKHQLIIFMLISLMMTIVIQAAYYFNYYITTRDREERYFNGIAQQIDESIGKTLDEIENVTFMTVYSYNIQYFLLQDTTWGKYDYMNFAYDNMSYITRINSDIRSMMLIGKNGSKLVENHGNIKIDLYYYIDRDYSFSTLKTKRNFFTRCYIDSGSNMVYFGYIMPIYSVILGEMKDEVVGTVVMLCSTGNMAKFLKNLQYDANSLFFISDGKKVIASNRGNMNGELLDSQLESIINAGSADRIVKYNSKKYLVNISSIKTTGWKIASLIPVEALTHDVMDVMLFSAVVMAISVVILVLAGITVFRSITIPVSSIVSEMKTIGERDIKYRLSVPSKNEIGIIAHNANLMLDKIEYMTRRIFHTQNKLYEAEISKKHAELSFFQSQINPHFLYNTLECVRSMAEVYNATEISIITNAMAKIFRYSVKEDNIVTIGTELECIRDYMNIMTIRYMGKYNLKIIVPDEILKLHMIKMILQPIVENSVYHGIEGLKKHGYILVRSKVDNEKNIKIEIVDNGKGMQEEEVQKLNDSFKRIEKYGYDNTNKRSIGLLNIDRRIKLNYGDKYGLLISSRYNYWTKVTVTIPKKEI